MPVYIIFSNRQLADIARQQPATLKALRRIKGIGNAKLKQYGADVLKLLATPPEQTDEP